MNEQLQTQFVQILKSVSESAVAAKDFVLAELPDVVQQTMNWYLFKSLFSNFIALIFICFAVYLVVKLCQVPKNFDSANKFQRWTYECYRDGTCQELSPAALVPMIAVLLCFIIFWSNVNLDCIKIIIAPKLWLIEYTTAILKK